MCSVVMNINYVLDDIVNWLFSEPHIIRVLHCTNPEHVCSCVVAVFDADNVGSYDP